MVVVYVKCDAPYSGRHVLASYAVQQVQRYSSGTAGTATVQHTRLGLLYRVLGTAGTPGTPGTAVQHGTAGTADRRGSGRRPPAPLQRVLEESSRKII